jgi:hypothetical protein
VPVGFLTCWDKNVQLITGIQSGIQRSASRNFAILPGGGSVRLADFRVQLSNAITVAGGFFIHCCRWLLHSFCAVCLVGWSHPGSGGTCKKCRDATSTSIAIIRCVVLHPCLPYTYLADCCACNVTRPVYVFTVSPPPPPSASGRSTRGTRITWQHLCVGMPCPTLPAQDEHFRCAYRRFGMVYRHACACFAGAGQVVGPCCGAPHVVSGTDHGGIPFGNFPFSVGAAAAVCVLVTGWCPVLVLAHESSNAGHSEVGPRCKSNSALDVQ